MLLVEDQTQLWTQMAIVHQSAVFEGLIPCARTGPDRACSRRMPAWRRQSVIALSADSMTPWNAWSRLTLYTRFQGQVLRSSACRFYPPPPPSPPPFGPSSVSCWFKQSHWPVISGFPSFHLLCTDWPQTVKLSDPVIRHFDGSAGILRPLLCTAADVGDFFRGS